METQPTETQSTVAAKPQLPGFIDLAKETFQIYKAKWKTLLALYLIIYGVVILSAMTGAALTVALTIATKILASKIIFWPMLITSSIIIILLCCLGMSWITGALIIAINGRQANIGVKESLARAKSKIISYIWTGLLAGLIVGAGFMFFMAPGIILMVLMFSAGFVAVLENEKGIDAIAKSREYVRGYFWQIVLLMALGFFAVILFGAIAEPFKKTFIYGLINFLAAPLYLIFPYLIYEKLKQIKGEAQIVPAATQKNIFKFIAASGLLMLITTIYLLITFTKEINTYQPEDRERFQAIFNIPLPEPPRLPSVDDLIKQKPNFQPPI